METTERQQAAVQAALEGLAAERAGLEGERLLLAHGVRALEQSTRAAVRSAVAESLAGAATDGAAAVQAATRPLLGRLEGVTESAEQAEAALRKVVLWASWRLLGWIVAVVAAMVLLGWLASAAVLWWDTGAIAQARLLKAQLAAEVTEMQANHDAWVKSGMLGKLERCSPGNRPCIRVDEKAGVFEGQGHNDYRIILGY
jgi:hypothetical protein